MNVAGVIIAGGQSTRMGGSEKSLLPLQGKALIQHIIERIAPQVQTMAINANGDASRFSQFGLPVIPDVAHDVKTPLAGVEAALLWAKSQGADFALTLPSDTPLLPLDLVQRLSAAGAPAMASSGGQPHYLTALWPVTLSEELSKAIAGGLRPVKAWAQRCGINSVSWEVSGLDPFININTPEELSMVERELRTGHA